MDLNLKIILYLMGAFGIPTKVVRLSDLRATGHEPHLSVTTCLELGATGFLAQTSARNYLDEQIFRDQGIDLVFFNPNPPVYPQLWGPFLPNRSALTCSSTAAPRPCASCHGRLNLLWSALHQGLELLSVDFFLLKQQFSTLHEDSLFLFENFLGLGVLLGNDRSSPPGR